MLNKYPDPRKEEARLPQRRKDTLENIVEEVSLLDISFLPESLTRISKRPLGDEYILITPNADFDPSSEKGYVYQSIDFSLSNKGYSCKSERRVIINPKDLNSLYNTLKTKLEEYQNSNINIKPFILKEAQSFVEKTFKGENNEFKKYDKGTVESFLDEAIKNKSGDEVDAALTTWALLSMLNKDKYIRGDARIKTLYNPKKRRVEVVCEYRNSKGDIQIINFYKQ